MIIEIKNVETQVEDTEANTSDCLATFVVDSDLKTLSVTPAFAYLTPELESLISEYLNLEVCDDTAIVNVNTKIFNLI